MVLGNWKSCLHYQQHLCTRFVNTSNDSIPGVQQSNVGVNQTSLNTVFFNATLPGLRRLFLCSWRQLSNLRRISKISSSSKSSTRYPISSTTV